MTHPTQAPERPHDSAPAGNVTFRHHNTAILSVTAVDAPIVVTSQSFDERLTETYDRTGVRPGMLSRRRRASRSAAGGPRTCPSSTPPSWPGRRRSPKSGVDKRRIALLIDSSVCREHLEPSKAVAVHHQLGLSSSCLTFDLSNACLGFVNAMQLAATMIDGGPGRLRPRRRR